MNLFSSIAGTVTVSVSGANIPETLDQLSLHGVEILHCRILTELEVRITVRRSDYGRVKRLCEKRGDSLGPVRREGVYWPAKALLKRPVLLLGMLFWLVTALYLPSRVLFIEVEGNEAVPSRLILEAAADCGIGFGGSRREVRSEKVKNALLEAVPQLQWAGVNTYGCVAKISVRERADGDIQGTQASVGHIIACREGIITACSATRGNLLCTPGQAVARGEILISGYTDCGLTIRAEQAEGEVFAVTRQKIRVITPKSCRAEVSTGREMKKLSLLVGKKRINLWKDSGFWDGNCDRMYEENYITLPGGFRLPFGWCVERSRVRELHQQDAAPEKLRNLLAAAGEDYLKDQMVSGVIRNSDLSFTDGEDCLQMTGEYSCVEMIGILQRLEIGDTNGESD